MGKRKHRRGGARGQPQAAAKAEAPSASTGVEGGTSTTSPRADGATRVDAAGHVDAAVRVDAASPTSDAGVRIEPTARDAAIRWGQAAGNFDAADRFSPTGEFEGVSAPQVTPRQQRRDREEPTPDRPSRGEPLGRPLRVAITGATGTLGRALAERLISRGDTVTVLSRDPALAEERVRGAARYLPWNGVTVGPWTDALEGIDAVVHLAGSPIGRREANVQGQDFVRSRILGTRAIVDGLGGLRTKPGAFLSASSVQVYGQKPRDEQKVDERAFASKDGMSRPIRDWESESNGAREHDIRTVTLRFGAVLAPHAGILPLLVSLFDRHLGGPVLPARGWRPWIHLEDAVRMMIAAIDDSRFVGPLNVTAPEPVRSAAFSRQFGQQLGKASWLPIPRVLLERVLGVPAARLFRPARRVVPTRALELGFRFQYPELTLALSDLIVARRAQSADASAFQRQVT